MTNASRFDRVCQMGALMLLSAATTIAAGAAFGGFCLEGSALCEAQRPAAVVIDLPMFNPEASLDAGQVILRD